MDDDNNNLRPRSYWWLIILLILAVLICIFIRTPNRSTEEFVDEYQKEAQLEGAPLSHKWDPHKINIPEQFEAHPENEGKSLYDKLNPGINSAIEQLQKKGNEAKRIIPNFPAFPGIWLLPSKNKGTFASIPERYCIEFLHLLFPGYTFVKGKHSWIRNPKTNYPLELDGYCPELMIAIEYNGIQHYVWPNFFHSTIKEFFAQRDRDQVKAEICIQEHICLIRVPYIIPLERIPLAIYAKLLEAVPGLEL